MEPEDPGDSEGLDQRDEPTAGVHEGDGMTPALPGDLVDELEPPGGLEVRAREDDPTQAVPVFDPRAFEGEPS